MTNQPNEAVSITDEEIEALLIWCEEFIKSSTLHEAIEALKAERAKLKQAEKLLEEMHHFIQATVYIDMQDDIKAINFREYYEAYKGKP